MTIETINIGATPNDGTGDDPRTTGQKLNSNFTTNSHAASRDVGTASGNVMEVGAFGLGGLIRDNTINLDAHLENDTIYGVFTTNTPTSLPVNELAVVKTHYNSEASGRGTQDFYAIAQTVNKGRRFKRELFLGAWSPWQEIYHSGNLNHLQNTSGGSIASNAATAGSNLTPAQTGTWLNASGASIANNGYGLWIKQ